MAAKAAMRPGDDEDARSAIVVWGVSVTEAEALAISAGGRARNSAQNRGASARSGVPADGGGGAELDGGLRVSRSGRSDRYPRSELTAREQQVLELVEQGFKNKEIAQELGIRPGTVKIHLKHIFEKTGVRGRYGLALNGWKDRENRRCWRQSLRRARCEKPSIASL